MGLIIVYTQRKCGIYDFFMSNKSFKNIYTTLFLYYEYFFNTMKQILFNYYSVITEHLIGTSFKLSKHFKRTPIRNWAYKTYNLYNTKQMQKSDFGHINKKILRGIIYNKIS